MRQVDIQGAVLRARREAMGFTATALYNHIHVPARYITAFEEGDVANLPTLTYSCGFLKTYCTFLELDPEPFLDELRSCMEDGGCQQRNSRGEVLNRCRPVWMSEALAWGAVCALILLGWFSYTAVVRPWAETTEVRVEAGTYELAPPEHFSDDL